MNDTIFIYKAPATPRQSVAPAFPRTPTTLQFPGPVARVPRGGLQRGPAPQRALRAGGLQREAAAHEPAHRRHPPLQGVHDQGLPGGEHCSIPLKHHCLIPRLHSLVVVCVFFTQSNKSCGTVEPGNEAMLLLLEITQYFSDSRNCRH